MIRFPKSHTSGKIDCYKMDLYRLAEPRNVSVEVKYDVLCLLVIVFSIPAVVGRSKGLNYTCWMKGDGRYLTNPLPQGWLLAS